MFARISHHTLVFLMWSQSWLWCCMVDLAMKAAKRPPNAGRCAAMGGRCWQGDAYPGHCTRVQPSPVAHTLGIGG